VEDLHWSCADTLAVIEYLVDCVAVERVLIVATACPEGAVMPLIDSLERRAASGDGGQSALAARPAVVDEVAASCLEVDRADVPPDLARVLETRAEGIPFLVEELLAGIVRSGVLVRSDGGWEVRGRLEAVNVPLSFAQTVRERLAQLATPEQRVVRTAAVLGRDFDWSHLPAMTDVGDSSVLEALSHAVELQLVENTGSDRFRFRHALTVDAILADMLEPQRARLAGAALDDLLDYPGWGSSNLLEVAAHLALQAGRTPEAARYLTRGRRSGRETSGCGPSSN
jgi:predicted ATPase